MRSRPMLKALTLAVILQYDTTHVYVAPEDFDRFVTSFVATFGGSLSKQGVFTVTPTPSSTMSQLVLTPVGTLSVFGFKTPVPYPFGAERTGYLVTDLDLAVRAARAAGADLIVAPFKGGLCQALGAPARTAATPHTVHDAYARDLGGADRGRDASERRYS